MNDWEELDDFDALSAAVHREQQRVIEQEVPEKIAALFSEFFGPNWLLMPKLAERCAQIVSEVQQQIAGHCELADEDFARARAGQPPVRH